MTNCTIAVGGENLIDQVTTEGGTLSHPGGSPFNVAMAAARQGAGVCYISPISTDKWGDMLAERMVQSGVTLTGERNDRPTTMAKVTLADGIPTYLFERDGTAERAVTRQSLLDALPESAQAIHTGSLTLNDGADAAEWEATLATLFDEGLLVSVDPNVRLSIIGDIDGYRARIQRIIARVHILKLSDEDLEGLYPDLDPVQALARIRSATSAKLVILTRGAAGATAWVAGESLAVPVRPAQPLADTVGAGDTFMASVLAGLDAKGYLSPQGLDALTLTAAEDILTRASHAAALNCEKEGCNPPTLAELNASLVPQDA